MSFAWPLLLWLLLVPAALLGWELARRRRTTAAPAHPKIFQVEAGANSLTYANLDAPLARRARPRYWLCAGLALAIVALARPQWGRIEEPVFDQSREILLAVDLSRSMLTPDVAPSRLDRAKLLIQALLEKLQGERVGLMVFSGTAFLQSPLSADYEILREFLPTLGPDYLPQGGSNYGALLDASIQAFGSTGAADRFLVILSDGEATDEDWRARIEEMKKKSIRVLGLGVGTAAGSMIPDSAGGFIKDERGAVVLSKLESATLQELARETNGVYQDASTWVDIAGLVRDTVETGQKGRFVETKSVRLVERFQWPLAFALWCLLASLCYEFPVRPRPRELKFGTASGPKTPAAAKAATTTPAAVALLALGLLQYPVSGFAAATLAQPQPAAEAKPDDAAALAKMVGRLSGLAAPTARDWAELGRETVTWGSRLQSNQQPISEGPVRDALAGVDLGAKLDPKATDWPKLRSELEALLQQSEEEKKNQQQQQQQDKNQPQGQNDENKDQQDNQKQSNDPNQQQQKQEQNGEQPEENQPAEQNGKQDQKQNNGSPKDSDFAPDERETPPGEMQKVGGAPEKKDDAPENADPALAMPLQKLEQIRNQDSPARLFQLMEGEPKPSQKKSGKDW